MADSKKNKTEQKYSGPVFHKEVEGTDIYVLGTAHISDESVNDVENIIKKEKPNTVAVELCPSRYKSIMDPEAWKNLDIVQVIRERKIYLLLSSILLSTFQKKMGAESGVKPGSEMLKAIDLAQKNNLTLELIDRDVQTTLRRAWQKLGFWRRSIVFSELLAGMLVKENVEVEEIEKMKTDDALENLLKNLPPRYNSLRDVILSERDSYMAGKLQTLAYNAPQEKPRKKNKIVAIVGAAHIPGIEKKILEKQNISKLETTKKIPLWKTITKFLLPIVAILGFMAYYTDLSDWNKIRENLLAWISIKAIASGVFALIAGIHPIAILSSAIVAPISNFNPILKPGWLAALVQARLRKPRVEDFEKLPEDVEKLSTAIKNRVASVFLAFFLPQLGSSFGTGIALWYISNQ